jgi:DDE superfamily endonuclease
MPHNLCIVDYALGLPGSVHDAYAFQKTHIAREHDTLLAPGDWIWADSAYPLQTWCITPFRKGKNNLTLPHNRKAFNCHMSKV